LNITIIIKDVGIGDDVNEQEQPNIKYYVNMPNSLPITQETRQTQVIYDLIYDLGNGLLGEVQCCQQLIEYNQSHVFTFNEYLSSLQQKPMEKEIVE